MYTEFVLYYTMLIVLNKFNSIQNVQKLRHPATLATIFLERPSLGSLVVRFITRDPIGISGDEYLCVAIRSLSGLRG